MLFFLNSLASEALKLISTVASYLYIITVMVLKCIQTAIVVVVSIAVNSSANDDDDDDDDTVVAVATTTTVIYHHVPIKASR